eukprot:2528566-Amphidinium_carterae.1
MTHLYLQGPGACNASTVDHPCLPPTAVTLIASVAMNLPNQVCHEWHVHQRKLAGRFDMRCRLTLQKKRAI